MQAKSGQHSQTRHAVHVYTGFYIAIHHVYTLLDIYMLINTVNITYLHITRHHSKGILIYGRQMRDKWEGSWLSWGGITVRLHSPVFLFERHPSPDRHILLGNLLLLKMPSECIYHPSLVLAVGRSAGAASVKSANLGQKAGFE